MRLIRPQTSTPLPKKFFEQSSPPGLSHQIRPRIRSPSHLAPQVAIETKAQSLLFLRRKGARALPMNEQDHIERLNDFVRRMNEVERALSYPTIRPKDAATLILIDRS